MQNTKMRRMVGVVANIERVITVVSIHTMTKQPARETQCNQCDNYHRPVVWQQQRKRIALEKYTSQDNQEIA
jgi:hypothetical protein